MSSLFLPDLGCVLASSLHYVHNTGTERTLFPCVNQRCRCSGVFFKDYGGRSSVLKLRVWVHRHAATALSERDAARVCAYFRAAVPKMFLVFMPDWTIVEGCAPTGAGVESVTFKADASMIGDGYWDIVFRPQRITGDDGHVRVKAVLGVNVVLSRSFEVRSKISDWMMLQHVPAGASRAHVETMLRSFRVPKPTVVYIGPSDDANSVPTAFVRFANRTLAATAYETIIKRATKTPTLIMPSLIVSLRHVPPPDEDMEKFLMMVRVPEASTSVPGTFQQVAAAAAAPDVPVVLPLAIDVAKYPDPIDTTTCQGGDKDVAVVLPVPMPDINFWSFAADLYLGCEAFDDDDDPCFSPCISPCPTLGLFQLTPLSASDIEL